MYKKRILVNSGKASGSFNPFCDRVNIAHPVSYYVNGGVDLDGVSDRPPLPAHFDAKEDISSGDIDIATDPRVSRMDIADYASHVYSEVEAKAAEDIAGVD